ncbi:hypothetical protein HNR46_001941 [Haloferula luteola]|uniref:Ice-binding protein C-terminal domain-containing protein n=1 Tax=Haloferula luteola TaxID=595692 RepID=A0A840V129_9BACT|nr:PEP-CTERM sorting domain-containing protein [Haloferula luteola]MBB5351702.1 hypothetical protein [Haloferula luteola]
MNRTLVLLSLLAAPAFGASVTLTASDGFGSSSFNSAGLWSNAAAPSAGNDYSNAGFLLRTPATTSASYTFGGDSLTITGTGNFAAAANDALMFKGLGTGNVITVSNLIVNGGQLRHGSGEVDSFALNGNITVGVNGMGIASQGGFTINSAISGSSAITVMGNGSGSAGRMVTFTSTSSTFNGNLILNNAQSFATLADNAVFNFAIGAAGVNNSISGIGNMTLNGDFILNLTGASTTLGDSWQLVNNSSLTETYGSTFSVAGFIDNGDNTWSSGVYLFDEATGALTVAVPEPSIALLGGLGLFGMLRRRRA